jgi:hypothetical protein
MLENWFEKLSTLAGVKPDDREDALSIGEGLLTWIF